MGALLPQPLLWRNMQVLGPIPDGGGWPMVETNAAALESGGFTVRGYTMRLDTHVACDDNGQPMEGGSSKC